MTKRVFEQGDSSASFAALRGLLPEGRDKAFHSLMRLLQEGKEKWHQRPFVSGLPRYEDYLSGEVGIVIRVQADAGIGADKPSWDIAYKITVPDLESSTVLNVEGSVSDGGILCGEHDHVVLVPVIDLPAEPQDFVAVLVGAHRITDEFTGPLEGFLHQSIFDGAFHFLARICPWKGALVCANVVGALQTHPTAVQRGPKIENCVTCLECEEGVDRLSMKYTAPIRRNSGGLVLTPNKFVGVGVHVVDVLLGPSHLKPSALE